MINLLNKKIVAQAEMTVEYNEQVEAIAKQKNNLIDLLESYNALYFLQAALKIGSLNFSSVSPESFKASSCFSCSVY